MKKQEEKKTVSLTTRIIAGVMALLMVAGVVVGVIAYLI